MKPSLSVIIPAFNEENNIALTIENVLKAVSDRFSEYEIIVFNDCSRDSTGAIAQSASGRNRNIKVVHNKQNRGFGYNYRTGVALARYEYISMIPGDNEISVQSICDLYDAVGSADIIIPYTINTLIRPVVRRLVSRAFTTMLNLLFHLKLRYYNGPVIHKKALIQSVDLSTDSFAFQAEALITLLKKNYSYREIGMMLNIRRHGTSKAFRSKNIYGVLKTVLKLFYELQIRACW